MPTYEFRCQACKRKFDKFFTFQEYGSVKVACPFCSSEDVKRAIGRIRVARSEASHLAGMADPSALDNLDDDPRQLGRMMREMKSSVGGSELGAEFDEVVDRLEKGQTPDEIDQAFPESPGDE
jgi:putative FmdB family regulatory protein